MITNVSDIINNIFEKIFENPEISFSHPNRTFQYAVRHGKLNEDYLALNEDTLERKLKTGIAQAIVKEFPACDPDVRVFRVRVLDANKPHIENEEVQAMREAGERVFVEFVGGVDTPYQRTEYKDNTTVRSLEDSFTADAVKISERQTL